MQIALVYRYLVFFFLLNYEIRTCVHQLRCFLFDLALSYNAVPTCPILYISNVPFTMQLIYMPSRVVTKFYPSEVDAKRTR